jgi:F-type H+-transporting ATPase subunit a
MIPFLASATGSIAVTAALALICFVIIHYNGIVANHGFGGYLKTFIPPIEKGDIMMKIMGPPIQVLLFILELSGAFIRAAVLAIRLFANMLAGHTVLMVIFIFIYQLGVSSYPPDGSAGSSSAQWLFWPVTIAAVLLNTGLSVLELFVACLQAYVFTYLTATFIGLAMHPEH